MASNPITAEYIAGLFDGEGSICCLHNVSGTPRVQLNVTNTNREVLVDLKEFFGFGTMANSSAFGTRPCYQWQLAGAPKVIEVLTELLPYLRVKEKQAKIAVQLCERIASSAGRSRRPLSDEEYSIREGLAAEITAYNKGGT
jgi:hypothetical protein